MREGIIKKIQTEFNENINSHVFLMETNNQENCIKDIKEIIKGIIKVDDITASQIDDENYIELIIIKTDNKEIKKEDVLYLQERLKTKPIISDYLFYIIYEANKLNDIAANKLLKTIEEPNENIIGFLITDSQDSVLPTIKSRCEIETLLYDNPSQLNIDEEIENETKRIIEIIEAGSLNDLHIYKITDKKIKENGKIIANRIKDYYNTASNVELSQEIDKEIVQLIRDKNSTKKLINKCKYLNKTLNKLTNNMNASLLIEKIYIELREVI